MGCKSHNFSSHHYIFLKFKYVVCLTLFYNIIDWIWFIQCHFRDNVIANFLGKLVLGRCNRQLGLSCFTVGSSSFFSKSATRCPLFFSEQWRLDSNFPGKFFTSCISLWQFSNQKLTYNYHLACPIPRCAFKIYTRKNFDMVSLEFILICLRAIRSSSSIVRQIEV